MAAAAPNSVEGNYVGISVGDEERLVVVRARENDVRGERLDPVAEKRVEHRKRDPFVGGT